MTAGTALVVGTNEYDFHRIEDHGPRIRDAVADAGFDVTVADDRDALLDAAEYDVLVDYRSNGVLSDAQWASLDRFVRDGGGYVGVHGASAVNWVPEGTAREGLADLVGGVFEGHEEYGTVRVTVADDDHPVTAGVEDFTVEDEPYRTSTRADVRVLLHGHYDGDSEPFTPGGGDLTSPDADDGPRPFGWVHEYGDGRVCYLANGHDEQSLEHPAVRRLLANAVQWAAGED